MKELLITAATATAVGVGTTVLVGYWITKRLQTIQSSVDLGVDQAIDNGDTEHAIAVRLGPPPRPDTAHARTANDPCPEAASDVPQQRDCRTTI